MRREEAIRLADEACPRCGSYRGAEQRYCVECGLRLPVVQGTLPRWRRRWLRRVGWYPGDWVWLALPALALALAGAGVSIAVNRKAEAGAAGTMVSPFPRRARTSTTTTRSEPNGRVHWPVGLDGWTVVLGSYPATRGLKTPLAVASRAARKGLPQVGVLDSSAFSSLHPGYYVVFSGVYNAPADAETALRTVESRGFAGAYPRRITP